MTAPSVSFSQVSVNTATSAALLIIVIVLFISTEPSPESVQGALQSVHCYLKV